MGLLGLLVFLGVAYLLSESRGRIKKEIVLWGLGLQVIFAVLVLGIPRWGIPGVLKPLFEGLNSVFVDLLAFTDKGSEFVFGSLVSNQSFGFIFAFRVLPTIIFFSTLVAVFYHLGILQRVVRGLAWVMRKLMPVGGAESLSTAANIFLGQTEAPLMIKPYLPRMSRSELLCVMIGGMANTAGGVLAAYVALLHTRFPEIAGHLLTVSFMSAPATLLISKIMLPETEKIVSEDRATLDTKKIDANLLEAATRGAAEGLSLALNVAAMLIAFIALVYMCNSLLGWTTGLFGYHITLQQILGYAFAPVAWLLSVPGGEIFEVGRLLGEKVVLNEFVAYVSLSEISGSLSDRSVLIVSYALCGFANFSSIGIQVGGIGAMVPERRGDLARLGLKALIGGNLATFTCAALVSLLYG